MMKKGHNKDVIDKIPKNKGHGKVLKIIGFVVFFMFFWGIPCIFCVFFNSDSTKSSFLSIFESSLSVEDWFSFWITYLAAISTLMVSFASVHLANKIETLHLEEKAEEKADLFIPKSVNIEIGIGENSPCNIEVVIDPKAQFLNPTLIEAKILFDESTDIDPINLRLSTNNERIDTDSYFLSVCDDSTERLKALSMWRYYSYNKTYGYEFIKLCISYSYNIKPPLGKTTKWTTTTYMRLKVKYNQQKKIVMIILQLLVVV